MTDDRKKAKPTFSRFEPGGDLGPIADHKQHEQRTQSLPDEERVLARECARFADLCQYFSQQNLDLPREVTVEIGRVSTLAVRDRIAAVRRLNQVLMEHLNDTGQSSGIRQ